MKPALTLLCMLLATPAGADFGESDAAREAREAAAAFSAALRAKLLSALQAGGPRAAVEACNLHAAEIARTISLEPGGVVSRVSLKSRNPENTPNDWQFEVLHAFNVRQRSGRESGSLDWQELAVTESGPEFRYMQAIPTGALCLQCHGEDIAPAVREKITELYPADQATGYREGDIRGAIVVTQKMAQP
jgi:hypothetical protein